LSSGAGLTIKLSNRPVPAPPMVGLVDLAGQPFSLESARGKVVLLNFWATWCAPCREEIPALVALQEHYRDILLVVGLSIDTAPPAEVKKFTDEHRVNYPIVMSNAELEKGFGGVTAVPSTFVLNTKGEIVQRHLGLLDPRALEHEVRALAGLSTDAKVELVEDTGQVLLENAAYATEIPGVDFAGLTPAQKEAALKRLNTERCACGCGLTLAQCRIHDTTCEISLPAARAIVDGLK
jgi:thiol-disulfide isomerase/thioredoxin